MTQTTDFDWCDPDYTGEFIKRQNRLAWMRESPTRVAALKMWYRNNPIDFINDWGMTYDPRVVPQFMPFILFPRQQDYIRWLLDRYEAKEDGLAEKCRDVGFTWLNVAFASWMWLFHGQVAIGFGSRKEMYVDRLGDPDSIFEKIRMFLRMVPKEFMPYGVPQNESHPRYYNERMDASYLKIVNIETGATITGEAGDSIGRGGRKSIYFKDESAFYDRPDKIEASLSQNSDVKIDVSTPNGPGNPFYEKRFGGKVPVFTFRWQDDPRKTDSWYEEQCAKLDPIVVAQEIDINYHASVHNICIPAKWVLAAVDLDIKPSGLKYAGLDVADEEGVDTNVICVRHGVVTKHIEEWNGVDTTDTTNRADRIARSLGVTELKYDANGVGAGVRAASKRQKPGIKYTPIATGGGATKGRAPDGKRQNKDFYLNLRAQIWWEGRMRFHNAYKWAIGKRTGLTEDDLISIPNDSQLIAELSQPLIVDNDTGKIQIEGKKAMKRRGVKSPNKAEALLYSYAPKDKKGVTRKPLTL